MFTGCPVGRRFETGVRSRNPAIQGGIMRRLAVAIGAVAVLAFGGAALAQTTGDERIYACVNNGDGAMKQVAGADAVCSKGWHQISWSAENAPAEDTTTYVKQRTVAIPENVVAV